MIKPDSVGSLEFLAVLAVIALANCLTCGVYCLGWMVSQGNAFPYNACTLIVNTNSVFSSENCQFILAQEINFMVFN